MAENVFAIDEKTGEGRSSNINVRNLEDFIQQGKVTKLEIPDDERWLHVEFTNKGGLTATKNFFFPKDNGDTEKYNKSVKFFMSNMANIARRYKGDKYTVSGSSAIEVAKKVINDVKGLIAGKEVFCLMELNEGKDGKIYTNLGSFSPLSNTGGDLFVTEKQKELLAKKLAFKSDVKPDSDTAAPAATDTENPF